MLKLNTLSGHLAPNFIWVFSTAHILVGNSFMVKFFHREGIIIEQGVIKIMDNTISLGMPHGNSLDLSTPQFAYYSCLIF
jgi:hypothetical protein